MATTTSSPPGLAPPQAGRLHARNPSTGQVMPSAPPGYGNGNGPPSISTGMGMAMADGAGGDWILLASTHRPKWVTDAEKTTRIFVVVYPSNGASDFLPGTNSGKPMREEEISHFGYGVYIEPKKTGGLKKLMSKGKDSGERTLWTLQGNEVKQHSGQAVGVSGMLVRFMVGIDAKGDSVKALLDRVGRTLDSVTSTSDGGVQQLRASIQALQGNGLLEVWDIDEFMGIMQMVVNEQKKNGTQGNSVTTIDYLAHVRSKEMQQLQG